MNDESRRLLEKGAHAIHSADVLLSAEEPDSAAGRAYYALFGEHFAKPGIVNPRFHRILLDAFESRLQADYEADTPVPAEQAAIFIDHAREFLLEANSLPPRYR